MTLLRRLALKISNAVVGCASPGCKEWAEGLAREVAFVDGERAALAWALGSVRVLFDYREAPIGSLADLPVAARRFAKSKRSGNGTWIMLFYFGLTYGDKFFHATNRTERTGCSLAVVGFISMGIVVLLEWLREIKMPPSADTTALIRFYKAGLERMRNLHRSPKFWITVTAINFFCVGLMLTQRGGICAYPVWCASLGLFWAAMLLLFLQMRRTNRRRLERLDAVLTETR